MKVKPIILTGDKQKEFIKVIASQYGVTADNELKLIEIMVKMDLFSAFHMDKYARMKLQRELGVTYGTLSTCLNRLTKAGVLARVNKNVYLVPTFRDLNEVDAIVFKMG